MRQGSTTTGRKAGLLEALKSQIALSLADLKAYELPAACTCLGLAAGEEQEAFSSKRLYVTRRLAGCQAEAVLRIALELCDERPTDALREAIDKFEELAKPIISELTRRRIVNELDTVSLNGEFDLLEFLRRLWPIASMNPTYDTGLDPTSLEDEIIRHMVRNDDWDNKELLSQLRVFDSSQAAFFRFLQSVVDPMIRSPEEQTAIVDRLNRHLQHDGYELRVMRKISGSPVFEVSALPQHSPSDASIAMAFSNFSPSDIQERWASALERRSTDPAGAITLARTLLEDVCKWIISEAGEEPRDDEELPAMYRRLAKILKLAPDAHTESVFKQILGSCQSIVESLGALRNKLGDAHSPGPKKARPQPRHAELAVNLAGTMAQLRSRTVDGRWSALGMLRLQKKRIPPIV